MNVLASAAGRRIKVITLGAGLLFAAVFAALVVFYGAQIRAEVRLRMIERAAAVLQPVVQQQIEATDSLLALLPDARREGMLALALFDPAGVVVEKVPATQLLVELPLDDFVQLQNDRPITRFHPEFGLSSLLAHAAPGLTSPVLEVVLPLHRHDARRSLLGFVRYHSDARALGAELAALDAHLRRKTRFVLLLGVGLISLLTVAASFALTRAQRALAERSDRLARTNSELTLASKASALGQIMSHLLHDLRGPVSGLQAVVRSGDAAAVAVYSQRLETLVQEAHQLLADQTARVSYELTGDDLVGLVHHHAATLAAERGVRLEIAGALAQPLDSHRGSLLCLIVNNLVSNALTATDSGHRVSVTFETVDPMIIVTVSDEGHGIPDDLRPHLFTPGRSGRVGGTGLGLAISQLLARQIGATLELVSTGPQGTCFRVKLPC